MGTGTVEFEENSESTDSIVSLNSLRFFKGRDYSLQSHFPLNHATHYDYLCARVQLGGSRLGEIGSRGLTVVHGPGRAVQRIVR